MGLLIRPAAQRGRSWAVVSFSAGLLCGCNALLGIEDLQPTRDAGADAAAPAADGGGHGGQGGQGGSAGGSAGAGGRSQPKAGSDAAVSDDAGSTGDGGAGGSAAGSGGAPPTTGGTSGGQGGRGGNGGTGGSSGSSGTVHGQLIDVLGHQVPNVMVAIGSKTATTDAQGAFSISDVPATYDVLVTISASVRNTDARISWLVEGLTRRDPTLQVYRGLGDRFGSLRMHVTNVTFPLASDQTVMMGWAGPDGEFSDSLDSADTDYLSPQWVGPAMTLGTAHALRFSFSGAQNLPTDYLAHDSHAVGIAETGTPGGEVTFDLGGTSKPASGAVSGSVIGATANTRSNEVYVRFTDTTALLVASDDAATGSFSYIVPNLPNAVIDVVARNDINDAFAAAYADNIAPNQSGVALSIPTIPTLTAPADSKTNVDQATLFQWTGDAKVFLFCANAHSNYDALCVLTSQKQTHLPAAPTLAGMDYYWYIETHGDFASVDAASGPDGFISSYSASYIRGPKRGNGTYAESSSRVFTTTP
jgi:hypothetical protein